MVTTRFNRPLTMSRVHFLLSSLARQRTRMPRLLARILCFVIAYRVSAFSGSAPQLDVPMSPAKPAPPQISERSDPAVSPGFWDREGKS